MCINSENENDILDFTLTSFVKNVNRRLKLTLSHHYWILKKLFYLIMTVSYGYTRL